MPVQRSRLTDVADRGEAMRVVQRIINIDPTFFNRVAGRGAPQALRRIYKRHPWVFAVLSSRWRHFGLAPFTVGVEQPDGSTRPAVDIEGTDAGEIIDRFAHPNRMMTGTLLWQFTRLYLDLWGECFWVLGRDNVAQVPQFIQPWPGGSIWSVGPLGADKLPVGWVLQKADGSREAFSSDQLVYFRTPNPYSPLRGCPPLLSADITVASDIEADDSMLSTFRNGMQVGGVLSFPSPLDDDQYQEIKRQTEDRHEGARKAGRMLILEDGAKFQPNQVTNKDLEYLGLRKWNKDVVLGVFNWPETALGKTTDQTFSNAAQANRELWNGVIIPEQKAESETVNSQLFRFVRGGRFVGFFDRSNVDALRQVEEAKWETATEMRKNGVTLEEINRKLDLDLKPQPGWTTAWASTAEIPVELAGQLRAPESPSAQPTAEPVAAGATSTPPTVAALDSAMVTHLAEDAEDLRLRIEMMDARVAGMPETTRKVTEAAQRSTWREWIAKVVTPSEAVLIPDLRRYMTALGRAQVAQFTKVAAEQRDLPDYQRKVVTAADIPAILFDRDVWDPRLRAIMRKGMDTALKLGTIFTTSELVGLIGPQVVGIDLSAEPVRRFIDQRVRLVTGINRRIQRQLADSLAAGFAEGESVRELRLRVTGITDKLNDPARTLRIARTEQGAVSNSIRFQMLRAGLDFHTWQSADDERVRNTHFVADFTSNDRPVVVGQPFSNGLLHPNDPGGPPGEVINCRCVALGVAPVEAPSVVAEDQPGLDAIGAIAAAGTIAAAAAEIFGESERTAPITRDEFVKALGAGLDAVADALSTRDAEVYAEALLQLDPPAPAHELVAHANHLRAVGAGTNGSTR